MANPVHGRRKELTTFPQGGIAVNCKAILSDLDGTLVDSTICVDYAVAAWAEEHNCTWATWSRSSRPTHHRYRPNVHT